MPSSKRNKARPVPDSLAVNDDGTIDLRVRGEMVYLRCPTVGELQKLTGLHARLIGDLDVIGKELVVFQQSIMEQAEKAATAIEAGETPDEFTTPELPDGQEAHDLVLRQRAMIADFWAEQIIKPLVDPAPEKALAGADLPAFLSHGGSIARAMKGWNGLPSVPGGG